MAFQVSPGVAISEVDLTTVVPSAGTTTGAFSGVFQWGPAESARQVENEIRLVEDGLMLKEGVDHGRMNETKSFLNWTSDGMWIYIMCPLW